MTKKKIPAWKQWAIQIRKWDRETEIAYKELFGADIKLSLVEEEKEDKD